MPSQTCWVYNYFLRSWGNFIKLLRLNVQWFLRSNLSRVPNKNLLVFFIIIWINTLNDLLNKAWVFNLLYFSSFCLFSSKFSLNMPLPCRPLRLYFFKDMQYTCSEMLMDWQVYQFVPSSKVKMEVRVLNPQGLCLYLGRWLFN